MKVTRAALSGVSESMTAEAWPVTAVVNRCVSAPNRLIVPWNVSLICAGGSGVVGGASSPHPAARLHTKTRAEANINRNIGNPILLDKIAGLSKGFIGMRVFAVALALSLALSAAPSYAQAPAPAGAAPQAPAPTAKPAQPAPAAQPPAQQRVPFQTGLKYAYVNLQVVATESAQGKAFNSKVKALQDQRVKELQDKQKSMQSNQEKLDKGATVLNETARAQLQSDIERQQRDLQRAQEDAQQELQVLTQNLQGEFEKLVLPALDQVAREKQVHFVFDAAQSGLVWADPSMDLTADVVKALDSGATAKPAAAPAAAAPATQKPPAPAQK